MGARNLKGKCQLLNKQNLCVSKLMNNLSAAQPALTGSSFGTDTMYPRFVRKTKANGFAKSQPPLLLQWTFLLLVFFIPLETLELGLATSGSLTIPRLLGFTLFAMSLLSRRHAFKWLPRTGYFFLSYLAVFLVCCFFVSEKFRPSAISLFFTLLQSFTLFWIGVSLFFRNEEFVRKSCMAFGFGCFILALCGLLNIGGTAVISTERGMERLAIEGLNPNYLAYMLAMSVAIIVGLILNNSFKKLWHKILLVVLAVPQVMMILSSGSRGGLVALMLGLFLYITPMGLSGKRLVVMIGGAIAMCAIAYVALQSPVVSERVGATVERNHQESRSEIYYEAFLMVQERPVLGWGPKENEANLGRRLGYYSKNPHNLYLQALTQTGIVGGFLLIMAMVLCLYCAWSSRKSSLGLILAAVMTVVLVGNMTHEFLPRKATWFGFALAAASLTVQLRHRPRAIRRMESA